MRAHLRAHLRAQARCPRATALTALFAFTLYCAVGEAQTPVFSAAVSPSAVSSGALSPSPSATEPALVLGTCVESIPEGKAKPAFTEQFPAQGKSGHLVDLLVLIQHGQGERILPGALEIQHDSEAAKALLRAGFMLPDARGSARPRVSSKATPDGVTSTVKIPVVPLPKEAGRHELLLPPLPVAMSRASGEVLTLCTSPHRITVEDPAANNPTAKPKTNPPPLRQKELWVALRDAAYGASGGLLAATLLFLFYRWWSRRPKVAPPPPPPRPPWELALESLHDIRQARLLEQQRWQDHFDRVSDTLREYLGRRFGFDGLESTTEEVLRALTGRRDAAPIAPLVAEFLGETDLVKFANVLPTETQCCGLLERAELMVQSSIPEPNTAKNNIESVDAGKVES
ncbi:MAG: hypothetical protein RJA70_645 [Pseudomonadota bacterium]|jgi:hypothetical protein